MSDIVNIIRHSADLLKSLEKTDLHTLFVMGDNQAHRFELEILSCSKAVDLTGATVTGYFTNFKEDTTIMVGGSVEDGKAVVVLSKPCYTLHGQFVLTIQVKSGEVEDTVFLGEGFMRRTKGETIIYDDYIVYDVNTLLAQIGAMKTATDNANTATANANAATTKATNAASTANTAAGNADAKAQAAQTAAEAANAAAQNWSNGTAANAIQLNGKDAVYYLGARNVLDNSYWALPQEIVNQRGFVSGSLLTEWSEFIDRWKEYNGNAQSTFTFDTSGGLVNGVVVQKISNDKFINGKPYTYAVYFMDDTVICASGIVTTGQEGWNTFVSHGEGDIQITLFSDSSESIGVRFKDTGSKRIKGHALIPGAYTADNLQPYVPKGYAAELAECLRHFVRYSASGGHVLMPVAGWNGSGIYYGMTLPMQLQGDSIPTIDWNDCNIYAWIPGTSYELSSLSVERISSDRKLISFKAMPTSDLGLDDGSIVCIRIKDGGYVDISVEP